MAEQSSDQALTAPDPLSPRDSPMRADCDSSGNGGSDGNAQQPSEGVPREDESSDLREPVAPAIARSLATFREVLPELLRKRHGQWVAIHDGQIIGFGRSKQKLYRRLEPRDLGEKELLVCCIVPEEPEDVDVTPAF